MQNIALAALLLVPVWLQDGAPDGAPEAPAPGKSAEVGESGVAFEPATDLARLELGPTEFGVPVRAIDLFGKVGVVRTWSG